MTDEDSSQEAPLRKRSALGSQIFGSSKSEALKRKGFPVESEFETMEKRLGKYVYQNHFPFESCLNAFCINKDSLKSFPKFLGKINTHWEVIFWSCLDKSLDDFHEKLYSEILRRQNLVSGRLQLCVIIEDISSIGTAEQLSYYEFQGNNIGSGFKLLAVLRKPTARGTDTNIAFGNMLFVFVADDFGQLIDEIGKLTVSL